MKKLTIITLLLVLSSLLFASPIYSLLSEDELASLSFNGNPFGLVYDGAIRENVEGDVNITPIKYMLNGNEIRSNLYTPAGYDPALENSYAAIAVAHPNGGVKEQVAGLFAELLAREGFVTIAADASYQGASGGEPRGNDVPYYRIEDIRMMGDVLASVPAVDVGRIGVLGICGGGGYTIAAASTDRIFSAVATLSAFNTGIVRRNGYRNSEIYTLEERLNDAASARLRESQGEETLYPSSFSAHSDERMQGIVYDLYGEGFAYYGRNYFHPNVSGAPNPVRNLMDLATFDAASYAMLISQPLLMVVGNESDAFYMSEEIFRNAYSAEYRRMYIVEGASHIETYYVPSYVSEELSVISSFFGEYL